MPVWSCPLLTDLFADTPGTLLENHVADSGATWSLQSGPSAVIDGSRRLRTEIPSPVFGVYKFLPEPSDTNTLIILQFLNDPALTDQLWRINTSTAFPYNAGSGFWFDIQQQSASNTILYKAGTGASTLYTLTLPCNPGDAPIVELYSTPLLHGIAVDGRQRFSSAAVSAAGPDIILRPYAGAAGPVKGSLPLTYMAVQRLTAANCP